METLVVLPLLTRPECLGIPNERIRSKEGISARDIGKGNKQKIGYIPDYCVYLQSLPVLIVEAKKPHRDVHVAYGEARLYATEINRSFPHNLNPCSRIISTDGTHLLAGYWDAEPEVSVSVAALNPATPAMDQLIKIAGREQLARVIEPISVALRAKDFRRPFNQGAGQAQIISRLEPNTFAADLSPVLRRYFSSRDQTTDPEIYSKAYVSSNEVSSYDRILEFFLKDRLSRARRRTELTTTRRKSDKITKAISTFGEAKPIGGDLQLVTGSVGVGKSLFARRYKEFLQPKQMEEKNHWAFLDFVNAPDDLTKWNEWVCEQFTESIVEEGAPFDLRDGDDQERIFAKDLADRSSYYKRMEKIQVDRGELERARDLEQWRTDHSRLALGIARYLQGDRGENLIVVFDNVDKLDVNTQLAAFQTALWFMDQTRCLVVLQMRDSTFEAYKDRPPLDTYKSGQIFHISPPRFVDVVRKRLELCLDSLSEHAPEQVKFQTRSGITISYPSTRAGEFLKGIYIELFQKPNNVSRILEALAGRNVRNALDMFMAIITSGHMPEDVIASVAQGSGFQAFPEYRILRALMRQDYRYFNNYSGFVANIFNCDSKWARPSNLIIPEILFYVLRKRKDKGDNGQVGFMAVARLVFEMEALGFVEEDVRDAATFCLKKGLIEVETSSPDTIRAHDSLKATASAWAHMRILSSRVEYIASVMPTTPINDKQLAARVFEGMQLENRFGQLHIHQQRQLAESFLGYLTKQQKEMMAHPGFASRESSGTEYVLEKIREALRFARNEESQSNILADKLDI
ncbi:hypothetical protein [Methylobacterium sp. C1]|uniref:hypothetical protein n=1 Tax=Methylobacterium sp. C1 TaxID=1479019 RepID=UPI001331883B|nr:hypothetical protein [Methylobacterium sp. C1]